MKGTEQKSDKPSIMKVWLIVGFLIIIFSAIFLLPPIYIAFTDSGQLSTYIGAYFIPFLLAILFIFIVLVVIYIYWHMQNQTDLIKKLDVIEKKLDEKNFQEVKFTKPVEKEIITMNDGGYAETNLPATGYIIKTEDVAETDQQSAFKFDKVTVKLLIDIGLAVSFMLAFITGLIKFPLILEGLEINQANLPMYELSVLHDYSSLFMGILILSHLTFNFKWMNRVLRKKLKKVDKKKLVTRSVVLVTIFLLIFVTLRDPTVRSFIFGKENVIAIEGVGDFEYDPDEIVSVRSDIFKPGHFSIFDTLVYLDQQGKINMDYHFEESMNTHVIDNVNGKSNWWYMAYYDSGWPEDNVFRMDHYPYKEKMYARLYKEDNSKIQAIYDTFEQEVIRKETNAGNVILPTVTIRGTSDVLTFNNVPVTAHNLRNDMLQEGTITAIDVIMSMGDLGLITYELQYYEDIGLAEVKNYFVERINGDESHGRCGFVYEEGSNLYKGFKGNHIHIPSDIRTINSPEYEEYFWICL